MVVRHGKNLNSDAWKKGQLWKHTSNPAHPGSRFSTGNIETLLTGPRASGVNPREKVRLSSSFSSFLVLSGAHVGMGLDCLSSHVFNRSHPAFTDLMGSI